MVFSKMNRVGGKMLHELFLISVDIEIRTFFKRALTEVEFVIPFPQKIVVGLNRPNSSYICQCSLEECMRADKSLIDRGSIIDNSKLWLNLLVLSHVSKVRFLMSPHPLIFSLPQAPEATEQLKMFFLSAWNEYHWFFVLVLW